MKYRGIEYTVIQGLGGNVVFLILSLVSVIGVVAGLLRKYSLGRWSAQ